MLVYNSDKYQPNTIFVVIYPKLCKVHFQPFSCEPFTLVQFQPLLPVLVLKDDLIYFKIGSVIHTVHRHAISFIPIFKC